MITYKTAVLLIMYITAIRYGMIVWMIATRGEFEVSSNLIFSGGFLSTLFWVGLLKQITHTIIDYYTPFSSYISHFPLSMLCQSVSVRCTCIGWETWVCVCRVVCVCGGGGGGGVIQPATQIVYAEHPGVQFCLFLSITLSLSDCFL